MLHEIAKWTFLLLVGSLFVITPLVNVVVFRIKMRQLHPRYPCPTCGYLGTIPCTNRDLESDKGTVWRTCPQCGTHRQIKK